MQNKNPQGNFDPIPDSDQELEKYGVWVKAEPQDLVEEPETEHQPLVIEDATSLETIEELSEEIEELTEMQDFDDPGNKTFEELATLEEEESSVVEVGSEEPESIDPSDFELDGTEDTMGNDPDFDSMDLDMDLDEALSSDTGSDEDTTFDLELQEDSGSGAIPAFDADDLEPIDDEPGASETGFETPVEDISDFLPEIEIENIELDDEPSTRSFDDVGALEKDLATHSPSADTVSSDLLQKIALELSSIKEELVSLRSQLGELKREPVPTGVENAETGEDGAKGGFFDDEDDDTIALTGDELDNILNTADFTVEPPVDLAIPDTLDDSEIFGTTEVSENAETLGLDWPEENQDLLPEDGSYLADEATKSKADDLSEATGPGIEAIEGDEALDLDFDIEDEKSPLELVPEINVITESPEDTSYLDEEGSELSDGFEMDASPLEEVPLMEPDLTELDLGVEIDDALAAEASEDLPFMESAEAEEEELILDEESITIPGNATSGVDQESPGNDQTNNADDDFDSILELDAADDEIVLSIDGDEQLESFDNADFTETLDEIEEAEPLSMDPFEDETFSELELHREGPRQSDGSWSSEPEESIKRTQPAETEDLPSPVSEPAPLVIEDFESLDFGGEALLGSQEVEDLGGEDLDSLEVIEELSEVEELDIETMTVEPELAEVELQTEEPEAVPITDHPATSRSKEPTATDEVFPDKLKQDVKTVLLHLDQLLASLPEEKIEEFASSEYYDTYKKLFEELGLL